MMQQHEPTSNQVEQGIRLLLGQTPAARAAGLGGHAAELEELLRAAETLRELPLPAPDAAAAARLRELVLDQVELRRVTWVHSHAIPHSGRPLRRPFKLRSVWGVGFLLVLAVLVGLGLSAAANLSEPDSPFYGLKRTGEAILLTFSLDTVARADLETKLADLRLREAEAMVAHNHPDLALVAVRDHYQLMRLAAADLKSVAVKHSAKWSAARGRLVKQESQSVTPLEAQLDGQGQHGTADQVKAEIDRFEEDRKDIDQQLSEPAPTPSPPPTPAP